MSPTNPYQPSAVAPIDDGSIRKVSVHPIQLLKRGYALIADQYWLFLGITVVGILIASAVPFGILLGPIMVGIYTCYLAKEHGAIVEFGTLFRGFDQFKESFIVTLLIIAVSFIILAPVFIAMAILIGVTAAGQGNGQPPSPAFFAVFFTLYPLILIGNILIAMPFVFAFQLIAERKYDGVSAVKTSARGMWRNFGGVLWYFIVVMFLTLLLMLMCYIPGILFMPISFAGFFLLYRDVFPAQPLPAPNPSPSFPQA